MSVSLPVSDELAREKRMGMSIQIEIHFLKGIAKNYCFAETKN
jgi:hypothetical protein